MRSVLFQTETGRIYPKNRIVLASGRDGHASRAVAIKFRNAVGGGNV